jgi:hypothetical protein
MDLWFRDDVARILASVHETMRCTAGSACGDTQEVVAAYQQGFVDALRVMAISFGLVAPLPGTHDKDREADLRQRCVGKGAICRERDWEWCADTSGPSSVSGEQ